MLTHKIFITNAEFNGLSSAIYRNEILHSQLNILVKISLHVICTYSHGWFLQVWSQIYFRFTWFINYLLSIDTVKFFKIFHDSFNASIWIMVSLGLSYRLHMDWKRLHKLVYMCYRETVNYCMLHVTKDWLYQAL